MRAFAAHAERIPLERAPGKYTFGTVELEMLPYSEGRFVSMLPARGGKQ